MFKCPYCKFKTDNYRGLRIHQTKKHGPMKERIKLYVNLIRDNLKKGGGT